MIQLVETPDAIGQIFNVGNDQSVSIAELAEMIKRLTRSDSEIVYVPYDEAYEYGFEDMRIRVPNLNKVREVIGYHPKIELENILKDVIRHLRENPDQT